MATPILDWLRDAPLWAAGAVLFAVQMLAREVGATITRRRHSKAPDGDPDQTQTGFVVSAILGLLALLIGFTFSMALTRFEVRQTLANQEAQALATVQSRLVVYREGLRLTPSLADYAQNRWQEVIGTAPATSAAETAQLAGKLWDEAVEIVKAEGSTSMAPFLLGPLGDAFDRAEDQELEGVRRLDGGVLSMLIVLTIASALTLGLTAPAASMRWISTMLFLLLTMSLLTILDLDQATSGRIRLSDLAWQHALAAMAPARP